MWQGAGKGFFPLSPGTKIPQARDSRFPLAFKKPCGTESSGSRGRGSAHPARHLRHVTAQKSPKSPFTSKTFQHCASGERVYSFSLAFSQIPFGENPPFNNRPCFFRWQQPKKLIAVTRRLFM